MTQEQIFDVWAPAAGAWSDWVKPVLFAQMEAWQPLSTESELPAAIDVAAMAALTSTAIVVDLPGPMSVAVGLALAGVGYRPVPLFNGAAEDGQVSTLACISTRPVLHALRRGTVPLTDAPLRPLSPPAFLLDSRRRRGEMAPGAGRFDNRWVTFPTDFPSARVLQERGISGVVVLMHQRSEPDTDLLHTLLRWQEAGILMQVMEWGVDASPRPLTLRRPRWYRWALYQCLTTMHFTRRALGGFGGMLAESGGGG